MTLDCVTQLGDGPDDRTRLESWLDQLAVALDPDRLFRPADLRLAVNLGTYQWQRDLADVLRADPFLRPRVIERDGWRDRGRPPAQFTFAPSGLIEHHTACGVAVGHDPATCTAGIIAGVNGTPGPISQLHGTWTPPGVPWRGNNADPRIIITAAGRANHAGDGLYPWGAPAGNGSALGIEWCGPPAVGEWPPIVVKLRQHVTAAILRARRWDAGRVVTHHSYAEPRRPGAKIDPSGPWSRQPTLPRLTPWSVATWRTTITPLLDQEDDMTPEQATQLAAIHAAVTGTATERHADIMHRLGQLPGRQLWARAFRRLAEVIDRDPAT